MKKGITSFLILLLSSTFVGCKKTKTYETYKDLHLNAKTAFHGDDEEYYLYFYTKKCPHCDEIKKQIFKQAENTEVPLYFINNDDVKGILKRTDDINVSNYGVTSFKDIEIYGFPTLILVKKRRVILDFLGSGEITEELLRYEKNND